MIDLKRDNYIIDQAVEEFSISLYNSFECIPEIKDSLIMNCQWFWSKENLMSISY